MTMGGAPWGGKKSRKEKKKRWSEISSLAKVDLADVGKLGSWNDKRQLQSC